MLGAPAYIRVLTLTQVPRHGKISRYANVSLLFCIQAELNSTERAGICAIFFTFSHV